MFEVYNSILIKRRNRYTSISGHLFAERTSVLLQDLVKSQSREVEVDIDFPNPALPDSSASAVVLSRCLPNFRAIRLSNLAASRIHEIWRYDVCSIWRAVAIYNPQEINHSVFIYNFIFKSVLWVEHSNRMMFPVHNFKTIVNKHAYTHPPADKYIFQISGRISGYGHITF